MLALEASRVGLDIVKRATPDHVGKQSMRRCMTTTLEGVDTIRRLVREQYSLRNRVSS